MHCPECLGRKMSQSNQAISLLMLSRGSVQMGWGMHWRRNPSGPVSAIIR
jgi:hypothetical protein